MADTQIASHTHTLTYTHNTHSHTDMHKHSLAVIPLTDRTTYDECEWEHLTQDREI